MADAHMQHPSHSLAPAADAQYRSPFCTTCPWQWQCLLQIVHRITVLQPLHASFQRLCTFKARHRTLHTLILSRFEYSVRGVDPQQQQGDPLPPWLAPLVTRIGEAGEKLGAPDHLNQATVNEYTPGVGLSPHIDTHSAFEGAILSISLAGPCIMEFRRGEDRRALLLPERSLLVMGGESRYAW